MKALSGNEAFNIVTVGSWNPAIFSPEWAKQHLADDKDKEVVLAIPMQLIMPPRLTVDDVNIYPSTQAMVLDCPEFSENAIEAASRKLSRIAELLPHTPVTAIGINFRYSGAVEDNLALAELFAFSDAGNINAEEYRLNKSIISRTYNLKDSTLLNISIEIIAEQVRFEFNFHSDVRGLSDAPAKASVSRIKDFNTKAAQFMSDVYGIHLTD